MRNLFRSSPRFTEKLATQKLLQWMTITEIDRLLAAFNIEYYNRSFIDGDKGANCSSKIELVFLSQWAVASGIALSKAAANPRYKREIEEIYKQLRADIPDLFTGLNNGVAVGPNTVVPRCWIAPDGNAAPAHRFFTLHYATRSAQYAELFASGKTLDEALSNVIEKAVPWILRDRQQKMEPEFADPDGPRGVRADIYETIQTGIRRFVRGEIEKVIDLIDG